MIAPTVEERRAHAYETEFAMLIGTSMIQVVSDYVTLIYIKFGHPNTIAFLVLYVSMQIFVNCISNRKNESLIKRS